MSDAIHPTRYTIWELATLVAERTREPGTPLRQVRDKVRHRIAYAVKVGQLDLRSPRNDAEEPYLLAGDAITWARAKYAGHFHDIPVSATERLRDGLGFSDRLATSAISGDLVTCQLTLSNTLATARRLEALLEATERELKQATAAADKWARLCDRNRRNAKARRKP